MLATTVARSQSQDQHMQPELVPVRNRVTTPWWPCLMTNLFSKRNATGNLKTGELLWGAKPRLLGFCFEKGGTDRTCCCQRVPHQSWLTQPLISEDPWDPFPPWKAGFTVTYRGRSSCSRMSFQTWSCLFSLHKRTFLENKTETQTLMRITYNNLCEGFLVTDCLVLCTSRLIQVMVVLRQR